MWQLFQILVSQGITPNQCAVLFSIKESLRIPFVDVESESVQLMATGYIVFKDGKFILTEKSINLIESLDSLFTKAKKKTAIQIMGTDFIEKIENYRNIFPSGKLPSGKPARQNVKALIDSFRWFFETYDYTWEQVLSATRMYVNEYRDKDYLYMMTSQYFISKQDKNKVKQSGLADYCDMIVDGVPEIEENPFKETVI